MITLKIYLDILDYFKELRCSIDHLTPRQEMEYKDLWRAVSELEIHQDWVKRNSY